MSRIGKKQITIPESVKIENKAGTLLVNGPKGELAVKIPVDINVDFSEGVITVTRSSEEKKIKSLHGLTRSLIDNAILGVSDGFTKTLEIVGTGYKAELSGDNQLKMSLGYSNPIDFKLPSNVTAKVEDRGTILILESIDKQLVGETAAKVRKLRLPDAYKGKGVRYKGEALRLKPGKAGGKAG